MRLLHGANPDIVGSTMKISLPLSPRSLGRRVFAGAITFALVTAFPALLMGWEFLYVPTLQKIENKHREFFVEEVGIPFGERMLSLNEKYKVALDRELEKATTAENLASPDLTKLQATYDAQVNVLMSKRHKASLLILEKFRVALREEQTRLTQTGRLLEALEIKNYLSKGTAVLLAAFVTGEKPGQDMLNSAGMRLRWIPAGTFTKGSPLTEPGRNRGEVQIEVELTDGYWIGQHEVTQAQYGRIMASSPSSATGDSSKLPVETVTWKQAMEFCEKLTEKEHDNKFLPKKLRYTLPTSAQWEYACRAGTSSAWNNGKEITVPIGPCPNLTEVGWYVDNSGGTPHPVGEKPPNQWGLHDMHGNVDEWVSDWFAATHWLMQVRKGTNKVKNPPGANVDPSSKNLRIARGGSFMAPTRYCRSAFPNKFDADNGLPNLGFRVILIDD